MSDQPDNPTLVESAGSIADALWEIMHELREIRRLLSVPDSVKQETWRKENRARMGI